MTIAGITDKEAAYQSATRWLARIVNPEYRAVLPDLGVKYVFMSDVTYLRKRARGRLDMTRTRLASGDNVSGGFATFATYADGTRVISGREFRFIPQDMQVKVLTPEIREAIERGRPVGRRGQIIGALTAAGYW